MCVPHMYNGMYLEGREEIPSAGEQLFTRTHLINPSFCQLPSTLGGNELGDASKIYSSVLGVCGYVVPVMVSIVSRCSGDTNVAELHDSSVPQT